MKPIENLTIARLFFNKDRWQYEDSMRRMLSALQQSRLIPNPPDTPATDGFAVDMARNMIVRGALKSGTDAVIWLDTDMIYPDDALVRLVAMANAGHMIAGGIYRKGAPSFHLLTEIEWDKPATLEELEAAAQETGVARVSMTAAGFTIVRSEVYHGIYRMYQQRLNLTPGKDEFPPLYCNYDFFNGYGGCGEDRFFMRRAAEIGITPVVDPYLGAVHWNMYGPIPVRDNQPELRYC